MDLIAFETKFVRNLISKVITRYLMKEYGYNIELQINSLHISHEDGVTKISVNAYGEVNDRDLETIVFDSLRN